MQALPVFPAHVLAPSNITPAISVLPTALTAGNVDFLSNFLKSQPRVPFHNTMTAAAGTSSQAAAAAAASSPALEYAPSSAQKAAKKKHQIFALRAKSPQTEPVDQDPTSKKKIRKNDLEKRRRQEINDGFDTMAALVGREGAEKLVVLKESTNLLSYLLEYYKQTQR